MDFQSVLGADTILPGDFRLAHFKATLSANQTGIADNAMVKVAFDTTSRNEGGYFKPNKWTPPGGLVAINVAVTFLENIADKDQIQVFVSKNGATLRGATFFTGGDRAQLAVNFSDLASGTDIYEVFFVIYHGSGMHTVLADPRYTYFEGRLLSGSDICSDPQLWSAGSWGFPTLSG
jgi:hypothetical protein